MPEVRLTHPDKVLFPADGITKAEVAAHYARVAAVMLPHVRERPLSLQVYPGGIGRRGHFLKQIPDYFPDWIARAELPKQGGTVTHMVPTTAESLRQLAQHNAIAVHVPTARVDRQERPDRLVLDFDPEAEDQWDVIVAAARSARARLEDAGLAVFVMTTGSRGLHVVAPIRRESDYEDVMAMARTLAAALVAEAPDRLTTEWSKDKREGRVFVDVLRNRRAHTSVAPWSLRAKDGAPVAMPLRAEELSEDVGPRAWTLRDMEARLRAGDPWEGFGAAAASPRSAARRLQRA